MNTFYEDSDGDGFGLLSNAIETCESSDGYVPIGGDCDDNNVHVYPVAEETCDELDNDCDDEVDEDVHQLQFFIDSDNDGFGN